VDPRAQRECKRRRRVPLQQPVAKPTHGSARAGARRSLDAFEPEGALAPSHAWIETCGD
jgi:hypothetical protein